jgi:hypothetical protein
LYQYFQDFARKNDFMQHPPGVLYEKEVNRQSRERAGWVFFCNSRTEGECLALKLFGSPKREWTKVSQVKRGDILYLHNYETNRLHGVFEAVEDGKMNIEPYAFDGYFPAQVRVVRKLKASPADKGALLPLIKRGWIRISKKTGIMVFPWRLGPKLIDALWRVFLELPATPSPMTTLAHNKALDGDIVGSYGERQVDDWLYRHVSHKHIYRYSFGGQQIACDWYIPEIRLHIEYWGSGERSQLPIKHKFYEDNSLQSIDVFEDELHILDQVMPKRIKTAVPRCKLENLGRRSS